MPSGMVNMTNFFIQSVINIQIQQKKNHSLKLDLENADYMYGCGMDIPHEWY